MRATLIQRVFALVELVRAVAAFMTAPLIVHLAMTVDGGVAGGGIKAGLWVCFAIVVTGAGLALTVFLLGGAKAQAPDIERWQEGDQPAWDSPPLLDLPRRYNAETVAMSRISPLRARGRHEPGPARSDPDPADGRYGEGPDDGFGVRRTDRLRELLRY